MRSHDEIIFIAPSGMWIRLGLASSSGGYCLGTNDVTYHNLIHSEMGDNLYSHDYEEAKRRAIEWGARHPELSQYFTSKEQAFAVWIEKYGTATERARTI